MKYNPAIHNRRSIRMKGYDYSKTGLYFITFRVQNGESLFGTIENGEMILNEAGKMIQTEWEKLPQRFNNIELHKFVVMPNHFHGIAEIVTPVGAPLVGALDAGAHDDGRDDAAHSDDGPPTNNGAPTNDGAPVNERAPTRGAPTSGPTNQTIGEMMGSFKSITTVEYINGVKNSGWQPFDGKLWQRNFYEHIIRNEISYHKISDYIVHNPVRWKEDQFYRK